MELELDDGQGEEEVFINPVCQAFDKMTKAENVPGMFRVICKGGLGDIDYGRAFNDLYIILRRRYRNNPSKMADEVMAYSLALISYLQFRTAYGIEFAVRRQGQFNQFEPGAGLPAVVTHELLPSLMQIQRHQVEMMQMQATTQRQRELARAKKIENDRAAKVLQQSKPRQVKKEQAASELEQPKLVKAEPAKAPEKKKVLVSVPPRPLPKVKSTPSEQIRAAQPPAPITSEPDFADSEAEVEQMCEPIDYRRWLNWANEQRAAGDVQENEHTQQIHTTNGNS